MNGTHRPGGILSFVARLPVDFHTEGRAVIAHSPTLDLSSHGGTRQEAMDNLAEAVRGWFASCFERGELDAALKECGFEPSDSTPPDKQGEYIDVPISLLAAAHAAPAHAR